MKCYPLDEAGEDFRLGLVLRIACLMHSFAMRDKTKTRDRRRSQRSQRSQETNAQRGQPQCQLQAPNRVTGATILNSAPPRSALLE